MPGVRQRADERSRVSYGSPRCGAWRSLVSALVWGTKGREFESRRPDSVDLHGQLLLVRPPAAPALDVFARVVAEIRFADHEELEAVRSGLVAPPRTGRDANRVPHA